MPQKPLPKDWSVVKSKSRPGKFYYLNKKTGQKTWKYEDLPKDTREKVQAYHILVKHINSKRPSSWRESTITLSKDAAVDKIVSMKKQILETVQAGDAGEDPFAILKRKFEEIAKERSDCSSAKRGGDLGPFAKGAMQKPFEDAAFNLKVNELSDIVHSDSGVHLILRVA